MVVIVGESIVPTLASAIAAACGRPLCGSDMLISGVASLGSPRPGSLYFAQRFDEATARKLDELSDSLVLAAEAYAERLRVAHILVPNPRLAYARVVARFFTAPQRAGIASSAVIARGAQIDPSASIGEHTVIGSNVIVGAHTQVQHHVVINERTSIGARCTIRSHTLIGGQGFGFERDEGGVPVRIPHLGGVSIGNDVEIGAFNTVVAGTIEPTIICDHVKTDDHVHVAHNVFVGEGCLITACAEISGSVRIGKRVWLGPNCSIINGAKIGDDAFVGIGAVITKDVPERSSVAGNPARQLPGRG